MTSSLGRGVDILGVDIKGGGTGNSVGSDTFRLSRIVIEAHADVDC
jgi:hypothetical protein